MILAKQKNISLGLSTDEYVNNFLEFFEYWLSDTNCNINVDYALTYVAQFAGKREVLCTSTSCLTKWLGICSNGDIYPCGRSYPEEYNIGNIYGFETVNDIFMSEKYQKLLAGAIERREVCRSVCPFFNRCRGGCNNSAILAGDITKSGFQECEIFKKLTPSIEEILKNKLVGSIEEVEGLNPTIKRLLSKSV